VHAPQYFPIKFLNLQHRISVHRGKASVTLYRLKPRHCRFLGGRVIGLEQHLQKSNLLEFPGHTGRQEKKLKK
jgi:hypothetical protein